MSKLDKEALGNLLRRSREEAGLTLEYMAHRYGCSHSFLAQVEAGKKEASVRMLNLYALETGHPEVGLAATGLDLNAVMQMFVAYGRHKAALELLSGA